MEPEVTRGLRAKAGAESRPRRKRRRQDDDRLLVIAADAEAARAVAARIAAEATGVPGGAVLRVAIGIAAFPDDGPTAGDLVDAADAALAVAAPRPPAFSDLDADATDEADEAEAAVT